jgi:hypothetical protein
MMCFTVSIGIPTNRTDSSPNIIWYEDLELIIVCKILEKFRKIIAHILSDIP